jgi:hypothetical protein
MGVGQERQVLLVAVFARGWGHLLTTIVLAVETRHVLIE